MLLNLQPKTDEETVMITARVYRSKYAQLQALADGMGVSLSLVFRSAINDLLDKECK